MLSNKTAFLTELRLTIQNQIAEYKHKIGLNLGFIFSLAIATSTLLSILILNHASKQEYQQANAQLSSPISYYVMPKARGNLGVADIAYLRKQGFTELSPILSFSKTLANGAEIAFKAIDLLPLSIINPKVYHSQQVMMTEQYAKSLAIELSKPLHFKSTNDSALVTDTFAQKDTVQKSTAQKSTAKKNLYQLKIKLTSQEYLGNVALIDIATAWQTFDDLDGFSYLMVSNISPEKLARLDNILPEHLVLQQAWSLEERSGFADALHLNLMALAMLAFVVSLFIAFQAANQAWHNRSQLMAQLRLLGVSLNAIRYALALEAFFLIATASILGVVIAVVLVSFLLPVLGLTLSQLYKLKASGTLTWNWQYLTWSLMITGTAVFLALIKQFTLINNQKVSLFARQIKTNITKKKFFIQTSIAACLLLVVFVFFPESSWHYIMAKYAVLLMVGLAFLPAFLFIMLTILAKFNHHFQFNFILQDSINQIARRFLPLAAFYIALTTSIAAALMVNSFESAFVKYLDQHLSEDLYVRFVDGQKQSLNTWLKDNEDIAEHYLYYQGIAKYLPPNSNKNVAKAVTVAIKTINSQRQFNSIVFKTAPLNMQLKPIVNFKALVEEGCFINEQMALKHQLALNSVLSLYQNSHDFSCKVKGIYFDYGNPSFEVTLLTSFAIKELKGLTELGYGVFYRDQSQKNTIKKDLIAALEIKDNQIFEPENIKSIALSIFNQTFLLTQAIAAVLLSIACFGLFLSANNLELARKDDLLVLVSLGYSRFALFTHMFIQWLLLAGGCIVLSWPIALFIAQALVTKVLPASFGWSMPLVLDFTAFSSSSLIGILCLFPALLLPLRTLTQTKNLMKAEQRGQR